MRVGLVMHTLLKAAKLTTATVTRGVEDGISLRCRATDAVPVKPRVVGVTGIDLKLTCFSILSTGQKDHRIQHAL